MKVRLLLHMTDDDIDALPSVVDAIDEYAWDAGVEWSGDDPDQVVTLWGPGRTREVEIEIEDEFAANLFKPAPATLTSPPTPVEDES